MGPGYKTHNLGPKYSHGDIISLNTIILYAYVQIKYKAMMPDIRVLTPWTKPALKQVQIWETYLV